MFLKNEANELTIFDFDRSVETNFSETKKTGKIRLKQQRHLMIVSLPHNDDSYGRTSSSTSSSKHLINYSHHQKSVDLASHFNKTQGACVGSCL
jgi:hypothetical protein